MKFYSATTRGFYDDLIHAREDIPGDAVEISDEEHAALLAAESSGMRIESTGDGAPIAVDRPVPSDGEIASAVRITRGHKLEACDWTQLQDVPMDAKAKNAWSLYRQALRDVPAQNGFPRRVEWPTSP